MTSTRDKAVSIFQSLIKDPYYQGSKDKSREEVVWIEAKQRARQSQNNEIALSMAASDSSEAVKALLRHLVKASALMTVDDYDEDDSIKTFMAQDENGNYIGGYGELSERDKQTYRLAVGIEQTGPQGRAASMRSMLDMVEEYPELKIPTTEDFGDEFKDDAPIEEPPASLSSLPKEEQLALFDGDEDALEVALNREQDRERQKTWATPSRATVPQPSAPIPTPLTEEEEAERVEAERAALENIPRMAQEQAPEAAKKIGKTHTTSTGKGIALSTFNLKPEHFLNAEEHPTELQDMQAASDSYGIPIAGRSSTARRLFIPVRLVNSISTGGHKRYPFSSFMKKLKDDLAEANNSVGDFRQGRVRNPQYLFGKREGAVIHGSYSGDARDEISFRNYLDDMRTRAVRLSDGTDLKFTDSPIEERLKKVEELAQQFSVDISKNRSHLFENQGQGLSAEAEEKRLDRVRQTITTDYNKRLREYGLALENLEESMADNTHFDVDEKDKSAIRTHTFTPELSAELLRLEFLEDASAALGKPSVTPFSDFMASFRFSTDEYDDVIKDANDNTEKDRFGDTNEGQHWENDEVANGLLVDKILPSLAKRLPKQLMEHLYTPKGEIADIDQWTPTVVSQDQDTNPDGDWYTSLTNFLGVKRDSSEKVTAEARGAPKRATEVSKQRAQLNQLFRTSKGKPAIEGMARMARLGQVIESGGGGEFDPSQYIDWSTEEWSRQLDREELMNAVQQEDVREEEGEVERRSTQQNTINDKFKEAGLYAVDEDGESSTDEEVPESVEELPDQELRERLNQNFHAFYDAILADESGREGNNPSLQDELIGDDKALFINPDGEIEWNLRKFALTTTAHLETVKNLIKDVLLPSNVPEGSDADYKPDFIFYGPASDAAFRSRSSVIPANATIIRELRKHMAEEMGIAEEDMSDSEELSEAMQKLNNHAPGVDMTYKELLLDKNAKSVMADSDMSLKKFLTDVAMPLASEASTGISPDLSDDDLQEYITNSQALNQFWENIKSAGISAEPPVRLASDIGVAMHPALVSASQALGDDTRLEEDAIEQLPEYADFENALRQMLSPRTSGVASKRQYDAVIPRFAKKLLQIASDKNYDSENEDIVWSDPLNEEVPAPILDTIRTVLTNKAYGVNALLAKDPTTSDLLRGPMTKTGGYSEWEVVNEEALSFFKDLLGPGIFNTWAGQKKFRQLLDKLPMTKAVKAGGKFGIDNNGRIGLDVIPNLFEILKIPATEKEWGAKDHRTVTGATRFGGQSPYEELKTEDKTKGAFAALTEPGMQNIVGHFYRARDINFYPIDITRLGTPKNAFQRAMKRISDTAFKGLGSGTAGSDRLAEQLRDDVGTMELNRPFNPRGYPLAKNSPAHLDDYVSKVLFVLNELHTTIEEGQDGEAHPLSREKSSVLRRIAEIENNYTHAEGEDSWRNQFHNQYWEAWDKDEMSSELDPELHRHIYNMWSGRQQSYDMSTRLNSIFSMEKVLSERGYDTEAKAGSLSIEQQKWMKEILEGATQSFSDMSNNVNNVNQGFNPDEQQQAAERFDSQQAPFVVDQAMNQLELRGHLQELGYTERAGVDAYTSFDATFPDNVREDKPIVPKGILDWFKSSKNYGDGETPSEEHEDKIPMLAEDASGDPEDTLDYLKEHPDYEMHPAVRRTLTNYPWGYRPDKPIEEARKLFTQRWDNRESKDGGQRYLDIGEEDKTGNASTVVDDLIAETERWKEYAPEYNPLQSTATTSGPINHAELYDHIANRTATRSGREMIHPHEEDYNHTDMPTLGLGARAKFNAAGMLDEEGKYLPEVHNYMNTLPKTRHETQANHMVPESMVDSYVHGFQNGFKPIQAPEPGTEGQDLNKSWVSKGVSFGEGKPKNEDDEQRERVVGKTNEVLKAHPMFQNQAVYDTLNNAFRGDDNEIDLGALNEWVQTHGIPIHPESPQNTPIIELPFISIMPNPDPEGLGHGGRLRVENLHKSGIRDIEHGGNVEGKKRILAKLYDAQKKIAAHKDGGGAKTGKNKVASEDKPQWEANLDYKMGINQQWISMFENQLISNAVSVGGLDPDDDDAHQEFIAGLQMGGHELYTQSPNREANAFKGYMHRWAAEHGLPDDVEESLYNHDAMKEFLSKELTDGKGRPLHYIETLDDGTKVERFRFRSFPFNKDAIRGHFVANHQNLFEAHGLDPDIDSDMFAQNQVQEFNNKIVEQIGGSITDPDKVEFEGTGGGPRIVEGTGKVVADEIDEDEEARILREQQEEEQNKIDADKAEADRLAAAGATGDGDTITVNRQTGEILGQGTSPSGGGRPTPSTRFERGGSAWKRIRQHLIDTTDLDEGKPDAQGLVPEISEIDEHMADMDEADLKAAWQAYSKSRQKTEQAKPKSEVEAMDADTKQKYIDTVRTHSHEMHGTDIHGDDKFDDMSDKQIKDAYDASHKEVSTHRAKQASSGKQNYANDIVTRLDVLPDGAPEDKILNQARSLTSEFLKHRTVFDKPALSHWQTLMQDLKAKAQAAGVAWEPLMEDEINQYQDRFGSPEHLEEVNETKRQQQQQQAEYTGTLDSRYAQAQQHPDYRPGHFVRFLEDERGGRTTQGFNYNNPIDREYDASALDELGEPPVFEDAKGNTAMGMYHPHSESWINPFVYEKARKNMLDKNKNPDLSSTSVIRNGRQWTNTHEYEDDADVDERHAFAIPTQKKQAELEQRNQNQMGYMIGTDGNIVGLDSDWNSVLNSRDMSQEQSPSRIVQDYHIRQLQQQHDQNPEYIGTRREAPIVTPKSPQAQQAQARSQQPPQQAGTAVERFAQRQAGTPSAKPYSFNPQDFMTDREKDMQDIGGFFSDAGGAVGRSAFRAMRLQNPFKHTPGIEDYWADRTKEYETQNKVNDLYHTMHTQYFGQAPDKPFYGSDKWSQQRATNEGLGYDSGSAQPQSGPAPDQFTQPPYEEQTQPKPPPSEITDALSRLS